MEIYSYTNQTKGKIPTSFIKALFSQGNRQIQSIFMGKPFQTLSQGCAYRYESLNNHTAIFFAKITRSFYMLKKLIILSMVAGASLACATLSGVVAGSSSEEKTPTPELSSLLYPGFSTDGLEAYAATYEIRFVGSYTWTYLMKVRSDGRLTEYRLHYDGVAPSDNPGDVRMVSDGTTSRMIGPGTDNECFLFPSDFETDLSFFTPDDLVDPYLANDGLEKVGEDVIEGFVGDHLSTAHENLGKWSNVHIDIWLNQPDRTTLLYEFGAQGDDPLFDAGDGRVSANFLIKEIGDQVIDQITGCELPLPVPESATNITSYPGLLAFDTEDKAQKIVAFYQSELPTFGWQEANPIEVGDDAIVMSYQRGDEQLEINIEIGSEGVNVEILLQLK
jgi:hypothetical protein